MAVEAGGQDSRVSKIILVDGNNEAVELKPTGDAGERLISGFRTSLLAAVDGNLLEFNPYIIGGRPAVPTMITIERTLELVKAEYKAKPYIPELLSEFNQVFWNARRQAMGVSRADLMVADCSYSEADIREFSKNDFGLFVPKIVSTASDGLMLLGKGFPAMESFAFQEGTAVKNEDKNGQTIEIYGWMRTEKAIDAPNTKTNQNQAEEIVRKKHRIGDTLNVYGIAGQQSKELTGQYLDEIRTWIRTLSSRRESEVLDASFAPRGHCYVDWFLRSDDVVGSLGARSVEVAKT